MFRFRGTYSPLLAVAALAAWLAPGPAPAASLPAPARAANGPRARTFT